MAAVFLVLLGSAFGGMARYGISGAVARRIGETFPWGTLVVNVSGCLLVGVLGAIIAPDGTLAGHPNVRELMVVGICGGYTTFSSFSLQTLNLAREGDWSSAAANVAASLACCLAAVWIGYEAAAFFKGD